MSASGLVYIGVLSRIITISSCFFLDVFLCHQIILTLQVWVHQYGFYQAGERVDAGWGPWPPDSCHVGRSYVVSHSNLQLKCNNFHH